MPLLLNVAWGGGFSVLQCCLTTISSFQCLHFNLQIEVLVNFQKDELRPKIWRHIVKNDTLSIPPSSQWFLSSDSSPKESSKALHHVMAWALDSDSGQPVYILDLNSSRAGGKCRCECPSCKLPLTGVNVGKVEYQIRPHFRHPNGITEKSECVFQAARIAALELLKIHGFLELPRRKVRGQVIGVSGAAYEVWVHRPAERVRIKARPESPMSLVSKVPSWSHTNTV